MVYDLNMSYVEPGQVWKLVMKEPKKKPWRHWVAWAVYDSDKTVRTYEGQRFLIVNGSKQYVFVLVDGKICSIGVWSLLKKERDDYSFERIS